MRSESDQTMLHFRLSLVWPCIVIFGNALARFLFLLSIPFFKHTHIRITILPTYITHTTWCALYSQIRLYIAILYARNIVRMSIRILSYTNMPNRTSISVLSTNLVLVCPIALAKGRAFTWFRFFLCVPQVGQTHGSYRKCTVHLGQTFLNSDDLYTQQVKVIELKSCPSLRII